MDRTKEFFSGNELSYFVFKNKYSLDGKETPEDTINRVIKTFSKHIYKDKNLVLNNLSRLSQLVKNKKLIEDLYNSNPEEYLSKNIFVGFNKLVPNGRVLSSIGTNKKTSLSNCFVIDSPHDSYAGIMKTDEELVQLSKRGGGVGFDISTLRPEGAPTDNAATTSTGAVSFLERYSNSIREVAQKGRRGALMVSMDIRHPDVENFATIKNDLTKVTGANISIRLTDEFMEAVEKDEDFFLRFPIEHPVRPDWNKIATEYNKLYSTPQDDNVFFKKIKARELWNKIIKSAHGYAEPGLLFWDNMINYSPDGNYPNYKAQSTNPCFIGKTKLLTKEGYKTFEELEGKTLDIVNKNGEIVKGNVFTTGEKNTIILRLSNKKRIVCTPDHVFLTTDNEELQAKRLYGKRLMPFIVENSENTIFTKLGFIQGDGNLSRLNSKTHKGIEINFNLDKDKDVIDLFGYNVTKRAFYTDEFTTLLQELKFSKNVLPERKLPETFETWNINDKKQFLKGLFSANGSVIRNYRISLKSTNKELIEEVSLFLKSIGIDNYITTNKKKINKFPNGNYIMKESYDLNIVKYKSLLKFSEEIGFIQSYKRKRLRELIISKAPKVISIELGKKEKVYDFSLKDKIHWGVVEGVIAHNCGEIGMGGYDACRLMTLNLFGFVKNPFTEKAYFDFKEFEKVAKVSTILMDYLIDEEKTHIIDILHKIWLDEQKAPYEDLYIREKNLWSNIGNTMLETRRVGLGIMGLADMLASLGMKYDSTEALEFTDKVMSKMFESVLSMSIDLAILFNPFTGYNEEYEKDNKWFNFVKREFPHLYNRMETFGRRNLSFTTVAPTGSISLLAQVSSGVEPVFMPYYIKRNKVDGDDYDYIDEVGDKYKNFFNIHPKLKMWMDIKGYSFSNEEELKEVIKKSPYHNSFAQEIDWQKRVEMQAVIQKYITHSISSTINLPSDVSVKTVEDIYKESWRKGLKGITVYRDGSRSGVYVSQKSTKNATEFSYTPSVKRPQKLDAKVFNISVGKRKFNVFVGLLENNPYEVFVYETDNPIDEQEGSILKKEGRKYAFLDKKGNEIDIITTSMRPIERLVARLVSRALRHGSHFKYIVKDIDASEVTMFDFPKAIEKALSNFMEDKDFEDVGMNVCPQCGEKSLIYENGCKTCMNCGYSACS